MLDAPESLPLTKGKVIGTITKLLFAGELDGEQGLMLRTKINGDDSVTPESVTNDAKAFLAPPQAAKLLEALGILSA